MPQKVAADPMPGPGREPRNGGACGGSEIARRSALASRSDRAIRTHVAQGDPHRGRQPGGHRFHHTDTDQQAHGRRPANPRWRDADGRPGKPRRIPDPRRQGRHPDHRGRAGTGSQRGAEHGRPAACAMGQPGRPPPGRATRHPFRAAQFAQPVACMERSRSGIGENVPHETAVRRRGARRMRSTWRPQPPQRVADAAGPRQ